MKAYTIQELKIILASCYGHVRGGAEAFLDWLEAQEKE